MNTDYIKCNLDLLTELEKQERANLLEKLKFAITEVHETEDGYDISIFANVLNIIELDKLKNIESKCCPFVDFEIISEGGYTVLKIKGNDNVKDFIKDEFGLIV